MPARNEPGVGVHRRAHRDAKPHELGHELTLKPRNLPDALAQLLATDSLNLAVHDLLVHLGLPSQSISPAMVTKRPAGSHTATGGSQNLTRGNDSAASYSLSVEATSAAQARASAMALTTSEEPLRASPATNTGVVPMLAAAR